MIGQIKEDAQYEDVCQTIFVKMVLSLGRLRAPERFGPWLFQIARNACRDHLRTRAGWRRLFSAYEPSHERVPVPERQPDRVAAMEVQIGQLPPTQRDALRLSLGTSRSYEEMAQLSQ